MMTLKTTLTTAAIALTLMGGIAFAKDLSAADKGALETRIEGFEQAFKTNNMDVVIGVVPPKIIAMIATKTGQDPDDLRKAMIKATKAGMAAVTIVSYDMALENATFAETSAGRGYALIPTETVMTVNEDTMQSNTQTLGFADEGVWYLVRIDDLQQVQLLTEVYPEFSGIDFPAGTMKMVKD